MRRIAGSLRRKKIPADVIYLDIDYQSKDNRPFTVDPERFPHFEKMITDLEAELLKVIDHRPAPRRGPDAGYKPYDEGIAGNHFVKNADGSVYVGKVWPGSVFPDFTRTARAPGGARLRQTSSARASPASGTT